MVCRTCKNDKPHDAFYVHRAGHLKTECRQCNIDRRVAWGKANPERARESQRRSRVKHGQASNVRARDRRYGLRAGQADAMLAAQGYKCAFACCGRPLAFGSSDKRCIPHIDHDHATGEVRWLLCVDCNSGLGLLQESPALLREIACRLEQRKVRVA